MLYLLIKFNSCSRYVLYTYYSRVLILTVREPSQNKRIFTSFYSSTYIFKGAILKLNYVLYKVNPPFQQLNAVIQLKLTLSMSLLKMLLQFISSELKSKYLFRTCSVATNLVTSLNNPFKSAVLLCCVVLVTHGTVPYSLISFISAALLQANTEPFRNALVKVRTQLVEMRNELRTSLVPLQNVSKRSAVRSHEPFKHEINTPNKNVFLF